MKTKEASTRVTVLGAGYSGLTTAAELTLRGFKVDVVAADLGYRPPLTIVGTQVCFKSGRRDWIGVTMEPAYKVSILSKNH